MTKQEAEKLISVLPPYLADMVVFSLATGLRQRNVLDLEWSQIDLPARTAWIHASDSKSGNRKYSDEQYEALAAEIENGGIEEFARFLCALPLMYTAERIRTEGGWQPVRRPFTPHSKPLPTPIKRRMVNLNKPSWEAFLDDWRCGDLDLPFISCAAGDLWQVYKAWCANTKTFHMQQKNFYANIGKRLADCRSTVKIRGQNRTLRFFAVPHPQLSETNRAKYPPPNTDCTARDAAAAVSKADYYGRQIEDFNIAAELPNI